MWSKSKAGRGNWDGQGGGRGAQRHGPNLQKPERAQSPDLLSVSSEAWLGNACSQDQMEGPCCSNRIAKGQDWKNKKGEISSLDTRGPSMHSTLPVGAQLLHGSGPFTAGRCW